MHSRPDSIAPSPERTDYLNPQCFVIYCWNESTICISGDGSNEAIGFEEWTL